MRPTPMRLAGVFALALLGPSVLASATEGGYWTTASPMPTARHGAAAATLDGLVYAAGGYKDGSGILATLEAYDPTRDAWTVLPSMPTPRYAPAAAAANGRLYVIGGFTQLDAVDEPYGGPTGVVEAYDPTTTTWSSDFTPMPTPRGGAGAAVVDGHVFVIGGSTLRYRGVVSGHAYTLFDAVTEYDPATDRWSERPPMPTPRTHLGVAAVGDTIYAVGGSAQTWNWGCLDPVEAFRPKTNSWDTMAPVTTPRSDKLICVRGAGVFDGTLYAVGGQGNGFERYDSARNAWSGLIALPTGRADLAVATVEGTLYAIGGAVADSERGHTIFTKNEAFTTGAAASDPSTDAPPEQEVEPQFAEEDAPESSLERPSNPEDLTQSTPFPAMLVPLAVLLVARRRHRS